MKKAVEKYKEYLTVVLDAYGMDRALIWDNDWSEMASMWHKFSVCGRDVEDRGIMWINGGSTQPEDEAMLVRACCLYFMAVHADLRSLREGITFVIDTTNAPDEKVGNERKLQDPCSCCSLISSSKSLRAPAANP